MTDFLNRFDPFRGDVLYGTSGSRGDYLESFINSNQAAALQQRYGQTFGVYSRGSMINDYNEPIANGDYRDIQDPVVMVAQPSGTLTTEFRSVQIDYLSTIRGTRYDPGKVGNASREAFAKGDIRLAQTGPQPQERVSNAAMLLAVRRACKFGITYVLNRFPGSWVHYVLDNISMDEVVDKAVRPLFSSTTGVPITTSELRFLFRNWNLLKNTNICFYQHESLVLPPWSTNPALGLPYAVQRVNKHRQDLQRTNPSKLAWFDQAVTQGDATAAVHWFCGFTPYGGQA